jgi:hypothetical protein
MMDVNPPLIQRISEVGRRTGMPLLRLAVLLAILHGPAAAQGQTVDFARDVAPLMARCQACHGPDQQMSGLRLDNGEAALQGGNAGALLQSGNSAESRLIHYLTGQESPLNPRGLRMPMGGDPFSDNEMATIRAWIDGGANWPKSQNAQEAASSQPRKAGLPWSFQPVERPQPPAVRNRQWVRNPIDAFVLARLESEKLEPSPEADRATLIRRVSLDLTGLLPTPAEVASFVEDTRPGAYERLIDRLLASPHYGETWGRYWLDQARFSDSEGHEQDRERPFAWRYRDWVIDSFNRDEPFDQFTVEQIAGDLLPNRTTEQWVATGFHRNALVDREGAVEPSLSQFDNRLDRTNAVAAAWLGISMACAQCHDHKYDPITQREYYQFMAFMNTFQEIDIDAPRPGELGPYLRTQAEYRAKREEILKEYNTAALQSEWEDKLREADKYPGKREDWDIHWLRFQVYIDNGKEVLYTPLEKRTWKEAEAVTSFFVNLAAEGIGRKRYSELKLREVAKKLDQLKAQYAGLTQAEAMVERDIPRKNYVHLGGAYDALGIEVQPGVPGALNPLPDEDKPRMALAKWLISPENPLTRRVAVNRIWQELFGRGIVRTSDDLGTQGSKPTHPELLDWLAAEFMDRGWSRKQLIREIVTSATYRQKSDARPELTERDPANELLARQARVRLPAEEIRDVALAASGLLDNSVGGPSVRPYQPTLEGDRNGRDRWKESAGGDRYRRGMYTFFQRANPYPSMINFDAPNANHSVCHRNTSNTPLQALDLLNDPVFYEAAQTLAVRTLREAPGTGFDDRLKYAYQITLARSPNGQEQERLLGLYVQQKEILAGNAEASTAVFPFNLENVDRLEGAAWVNVSRVLLNLDEFITRQ